MFDGLQKYFLRREQKAILSKSDLLFARDEIVDMHKMMSIQAEKAGGEYIFKTEYVTALRAFQQDPKNETAQALLDEAPHLIEYFKMCSPGHDFHSTSHQLKQRGLKL